MRGVVRPVGKIALITGAGTGIRLACACAFTRAGAAVAVVDKDRESGEKAVASLAVGRGDQAAARAARKY
jgi:NAD(P)-dependent dehydrogenase (short-subunit alcohol dehydrogenase family)